MITTWLITIITFLIGYFIGKGSVNKETYQEIKKEIEHKVYPHFRQPSGIIQRPDAKRIKELSDPAIEGEKEAMRDLLGNLDKVEPLTP